MIQKIFDTNFEIDRALPKGKNNKVIWPMKDELGGHIMKKFLGWQPKSYNYLKDNNDEGKKVKGTKSVSQKENLNFSIVKTVLKHQKL